MANSPKGTDCAQAPARKRRSNAADLEATGETEFRFTEIGDWSTAHDQRGFDPYNSTQGKPNVEAWKPKRR